MSIDAVVPVSPWCRLTQLAFVIAIAIVIARLTSIETLRDAWDITPGSPLISRGPGAASGLVLDLLAAVPALLVLARRVLDRDFRLVSRWTYLAMFLLGAWVLASAAWATDKFAAIVTASHLFAGFSLLWATSQIVRTWSRLRLVAAVCFGLLMLLVVQSMLYRFIDVPADQRYWSEHRAEILKERNWEPNSFSAIQFERKVNSGELVGFFASPNTFAAVAVMLLFVSAGIGLQKVRDDDGAAWLAIPAVAAAASIWIIAGAHSKTSGATPVIGAAMLAIVVLWHAQLRQHARLFFWSVVLVVVLGLAALVAIGLHQHGLFRGHFSNSLDFRWKYWVAAARIFVEHPLRGVGWSNFGPHYIGVRLPEASEEVKDPHNFVVRFVVETGVIGGALAIAWLLRLWWEMARPRSDEVRLVGTEPETIVSVIWIVLAGIALSIIVNVDFTQEAADVGLELLRRVLYLLALMLATLVAAMRSPHQLELDDRPAPLLVVCVLMALGLFLIHNLIDFSLFEIGPMFAFLLLAGAALGIAPTPQPERSHRAIATGALVGGVILWFIAATMLVAPVVAAEQSAFEANESIRTAPTTDHPDVQASHYAKAAQLLGSALDRIPYNADYALRCAKAMLGTGQVDQAEQMLANAIQIDPMFVDAYLLRANIELHNRSPNIAQVQADFDTILRLNPNDVSLHTQYGDALARFGLNEAARQQYELALKYNDQLLEGEPKRLTREQIDELRQKIAHLSG
jgi:O-antigen ligase